MGDDEADDLPIEPMAGDRDLDEDDHDEQAEADEDAIADIAVNTLASLSRATTTLRVVAGLATALWVIAVVANFTTFWQQYHDIESNNFTGTASGDSGDTMWRILAATLTSSWGYLIVAVLAFAAATYVETRRAEMLLDVLAD